MHFLSPSTTISADGQKDITYEREAMSESICSELHFPSVWSMYIVMHTCRRIAFTFNEVLSGCERYKNAKITLQAGRPHHPFLISYISIPLMKYLTWHLRCLNRGFLLQYFSFYSPIARLLWNPGKLQVPLLTNLVSRMKASVLTSQSVPQMASVDKSFVFSLSLLVIFSLSDESMVELVLRLSSLPHSNFQG